ncbi:uncharacterized protein DMENIID0001_147430 [Sergentomyia squamirostris]
MDLFTQKSFVVEYWQYVLPIATIIFTVILVNITRKVEKPKQKIPVGKINKESVVKGGLPDDEPSFDAGEELTPALEGVGHIPYPGIRVPHPGGINGFYEMANDRRSVRKYSSRPVDWRLIEKCIHAAGTGPSGAHTEPWTFCVVGNTEIKQQIREIIENEEYTNYAQRMSRQWTTDLLPLRTNFIKEYLTEAPYLVLVFKQGYSVRPDGQKKQHYYNEISTAISVGILLCAIQSAGLNSLVTTPLNCGPALRTLLDRPASEKLLVLLPIGYAADDCEIPDIHRKAVNEILVKY